MKKFLCATLALFFAPGCSGQNGETLTEIIPDDYAPGKVYYIFKNSAAGRDVPVINGSYVYDYTITDNTYDTFQPYRVWRKRILVTKSGNPVVGVATQRTNRAASVRQLDGSFAGTGDDDGAKMIITILPAP
jgi:hypothetical protein